MKNSANISTPKMTDQEIVQELNYFSKYIYGDTFIYSIDSRILELVREAKKRKIWQFERTPEENNAENIDLLRQDLDRFIKRVASADKLIEERLISLEKSVSQISLKLDEDSDKASKQSFTDINMTLNRHSKRLDEQSQKIKDAEICIRGLNKSIMDLHIGKQDRDVEASKKVRQVDVNKTITPSIVIRENQGKLHEISKNMAMEILSTQQNIVYSNDTAVQDLQNELITSLNRWINKVGVIKK